MTEKEQKEQKAVIRSTPENAADMRALVKSWPELEACMRTLHAQGFIHGLRDLQITLTGPAEYVAKGLAGVMPENAKEAP